MNRSGRFTSMVQWIGWVVVFTASPALAKDLDWSDDYKAAMQQAKEENKMMFIHFVQNSHQPEVMAGRFPDLDDPQTESLLSNYVCVRLSVDCKVVHDGDEIQLLEHPAFAEMNRSPGVSIIDLIDPESANYGHVVSVYPVSSKRRLTQKQLHTLLQLPPGTLTQRTLVFAVRTHPDQPLSSEGTWHPILVEESEKHSKHQASIRLQGHHNWERRFHRINGRLGNGMTSQEVCAESWPGQGLMDAAEECVHSWRQSSGHWSAVRRHQTLYGYDMKRGSNGVWYATGIFAR